MSIEFENNRIICSQYNSEKTRYSNYKKEIKKQGIIEFNYINKEEFLNLKNKIIIGSIFLNKQTNSKTKNIFRIETSDNTFNFELIQTLNQQELIDKINNLEQIPENKTLKLSFIGYIQVDENIFVEVYKESIQNAITKIISSFILLIVIITLTIISVKNNRTTEIEKIETKTNIEIANTEDWNGQMPQNGENSKQQTGEIEIPGYANLFITLQNPTIELINPTKNDVYFIYTIKNGEEIIEQTKAIEPGKVLNLDIGTKLGIGEHNLTFEISCFDIKTQKPCNGAIQSVKVTVK